MLRIRMLSGEEVGSIPVGELTDVRELKLRLRPQLHGCPPRFRQRLFHCGNPMDDSVKLDSEMDLELVLLTYSASSETQAEELVTAAGSGSKTEVCTVKAETHVLFSSLSTWSPVVWSEFYTCIYTHTNMFMFYIYICTCICIYTHKYMFMFYIYICTCICIEVHICPFSL